MLSFATLGPESDGLSLLNTGRDTDLQALLAHGSSGSLACAALHLKAVACAGTCDTREVYVTDLGSARTCARWAGVLSCTPATTTIFAGRGATDDDDFLFA